MKPKFTPSGWLVVNKPEGVESFGVIRKLKFRYQFHKIGFAGTLDPLASGILLIGINKATKLIPQVHLAKKRYEVQIRFGAITPTLDSEGRYALLEPVSH
jgi:tRNA pseudouridine55 synthase